MFNIKMSRYQAFVYFMASYMERKDFNGEESRMALHEETDTLLAQYIIGESTPAKFMTSSKTNINYVTILDGDRNYIPDFIYNFFRNKDIVFLDMVPYIVLDSETDVLHYRTWIKMKPINAMLYDGNKSILNKVISKLLDDGYLRYVDETHRKIYNKSGFVDGKTSIATRQYEFSKTRDLNNLETVFTDKYYITFNDFFDNSTLLSHEKILENLLIKLSKNSIIDKGIKHEIIDVADIYNTIDIKIKKFFSSLMIS